MLLSAKGSRITVCPEINPRQAEKEVPQPQVFVAFGFSKTNPRAFNPSW